MSRCFANIEICMNYKHNIEILELKMSNNYPLILDMVHHNPGDDPFKSHFLDPDYLKSMGYNGMVLNRHVHAAVNLDIKNLPKATKDEQQWQEQYAGVIRKDIQRIKDAGILCFAWIDFVVLPIRIVDALGDKILAPDTKRHEYDIKGAVTPDIHSPLLQEILCQQIDQTFSAFPELDGLVVRVGETYLHDLPYHIGGDPITRGVDSHVLMLNLLCDAVCEKHRKTLVYRTWLSGIDEDPGAYKQVSERVPTHPLLVLSVKHCTGDFHRTHPFSPMLGLGQHHQMMEIQCQREYEGKGAYPNYIAGGGFEGFAEYRNLMPKGASKCIQDIMNTEIFGGVWTWSRGGGWKGPYIKNEFWCAMNASVIAGKASSPETPTSECLKSFFADAGFDQDDVEHLTKIAELSSDAVLSGIASQKGGIDTLWTRDHYIGGIEDSEQPMAKAVKTVIESNRTDEIIKEREFSVSLWKEIESISRHLESSDAELREFIKITCTYGRICFEVFEATWKICLLTKEGDISGTYQSERIGTAIEAYDAAWKEWKELKDSSPLCPTLYCDTYCRYVRDKGMFPASGIGDTVARVRKMMNENKKKEIL